MGVQELFGDFIISSSNRLCALALVLLSDIGSSPPLFSNIFISAQGPWGKSLLTDTLSSSLQAKNISFSKVNAASFIEMTRKTETTGQQHPLSYWQEQQIVIFDDIHMLSENKKAQSSLVQIFDARQKPGKYFVSTSYAPVHNLELMESLRSRLGGGLVLKIDPPEYDLLEKLAFKKAQELNFPLNPEMAAQIIKSVNSDPRLIYGHLQSASFIVSRLKAGPQEAINRVCPEKHGDGNKNVSIEEIITGVSSAFAIKESDLTGHSKIRETAWPRRVAMFLAREMTTLTTTEIGAALGGRDHSTIIHGLKKIKVELKNTTRLKLVDNIKRSIIMDYKP